MPEKYRDSINLPIAIPAWGLVVLLCSAIFTAGVTFNKLDTLIENSKSTAATIATIQEQRRADYATVNTLQVQYQNHESRLSNLERVSIKR